MSKIEEAPGTVAVLFASDAARYSAFTADLTRLELPEGSVFDYGFRDTPQTRNELVDRAIGRDSYWIWFISEDHSFEADVVKVLLSHDQPIMAPIVLSRQAPFYPEAYTGVSRDGSRIPMSLNDVTGPGQLTEIQSAGGSGLLVRRVVFDVVDKPWFTDAGSTEFCERAREADFPAYLDTSARLGNRCTASMNPVHKAGRWQVSVTVGDEAEIMVPLKHR